MTQEKSNKYSKLLFFICYVAYFSTYVGRLNFNASIAEIITVTSITKSQAGLISTSAFLCYGIGQFINGFLGDRISSKKLLSIGLFCSGITNLLFPLSNNVTVLSIVWGLNGFFQSMTWSPILNLFVKRLIYKDRLKACVNIATSVPLGTLATYGITALIIFMSNWKVNFYFSGAFLIVVALIVYLIISFLEKNQAVVENEELSSKKEEKQGILKIIFSYGIVFVAFTVLTHGFLKDGITTWVPTYISDIYSTSSSFSIMLTMLLPITNLLGVYSASYLNTNYIKNELTTSGIYFLIALISLIMLCVYKGNIIVSLLLLCAATSSMYGVNTMTISIIPLRFAKLNMVSSITGILNSFTYIGSAISSYGIGAIADKLGWTANIIIWSLICFVSAAVCFSYKKKWNDNFEHLKKGL